MKENKAGLYWKLFTSMLYLSAFTFGGGYVIISLMKNKFVDEYKWIDEEEMLNFAAIAQSSPGAVAVNASIIVGYKLGGVMGAIISVLGTVIPPLTIISTISFFYKAFQENLVVQSVLKGMQAGVSAVIVDVVLSLGANVVKEKSIISMAVMVLSFIATYFFGVNIILIILICGVIGALRAIISGKKAKGAN